MIDCSPWVKLVYGEALAGSSLETIYLVHQRSGKYLIVDEKNAAIFKASKSGVNSLAYKNIHAIEDHEIQELQRQLDFMGMGKKPNTTSKLSQGTDQFVTYKIPIIKPDLFLGRYPRLTGVLFSKQAIYLWIILWSIALWPIIGQWNAFFSGYKAYTLQGAPLMIVATIMAKIVHEYGHAFAIKSAGGRVGAIGLMLIGFMPLPYTEGKLLHNATRMERVRIALAGIYGESWFTALALIAWSGLPDGQLRSVCHFLVVVSFGLTVVANLLPLMKFDGYQALSGGSRNPLLYEDAAVLFRRIAYWFVGLSSKEQALEAREWTRKLLPIYGAAILIWRIVLPLSLIVGFMVLSSSMIGYEPMIALAFSLLVLKTMWLKPFLREKERMKVAYAAQGGFATSGFIGLTLFTALLFWLVVPVAHTQKAPMMILNNQTPIVINSTSNITNIKPYGWINKGDEIAIAEDINLGFDSEAISAEKSVLSASLGDVTENQALLDEQLRGIKIGQDELEDRRNEQTITAPSQGHWQPHKHSDLYQRGDELGVIIDPGKERRIVVFLNKDQAARASDYFIATALTLDGRQEKTVLIHDGDMVIQTSTNNALIEAGLLVKAENSPVLPYVRYVGNIDINGPDGYGHVYFKNKYSLAKEFAIRWWSRVITFQV